MSSIMPHEAAPPWLFLSVLATQAAIAVENAVLYRKVQEQLRALDACNKEIQQLHDELQRQIQQCPVRVANALVALHLVWASLHMNCSLVSGHLPDPRFLADSKENCHTLVCSS
ncbi:MAG TPA: hypothetical protein PK156_29870 [Polyangium sp.]|nr:hypothetical protein [Polyangium sp.]